MAFLARIWVWGKIAPPPPFFVSLQPKQSLFGEVSLQSGVCAVGWVFVQLRKRHRSLLNDVFDVPVR